MYSAKICNKQMDTEFELYLPEYSIPEAEVQTNYKEIPFKDGAIDKTSADGVVYFKNREWDLVFKKTGSNVSANDLPALSKAVRNAIHGRAGEIIFDDDLNYKWIGRAFVGECLCEQNGMLIVNVHLITNPYKYGVSGISVTKNLSSDPIVINLQNGRKPIIPVIVVSDTATVTFTINGVSYTSSLNSGTHTVPDLVLFEGETSIVATGSGTIKFEYPEVSL